MKEATESYRSIKRKKNTTHNSAALGWMEKGFVCLPFSSCRRDAWMRVEGVDTHNNTFSASRLESFASALSLLHVTAHM